MKKTQLKWRQSSRYNIWISNYNFNLSIKIGKNGNIWTWMVFPMNSGKNKQNHRLFIWDRQSIPIYFVNLMLCTRDIRWCINFVWFYVSFFYVNWIIYSSEQRFSQIDHLVPIDICEFRLHKYGEKYWRQFWFHAIRQWLNSSSQRFQLMYTNISLWTAAFTHDTNDKITI